MLEEISLETLSRSRWEGGSAHIAWSFAVPSVLQLLLLSAAEGCGVVYLWVSSTDTGGLILTSKWWISGSCKVRALLCAVTRSLR